MIQIYGLTETAPLLTINRTPLRVGRPRPRPSGPSKLSRAGVPAVGIDLQVDGQGEVLARGNHILKSYWDQPEATADALEGGWFHTGDGGDLDEGGYLTISDRKKDVIISGGENVSSIEVEDALVLPPGRGRGVRDRRARREVGRDGQGPRRAGRRAPAATEAELRAWCKERLAGYKCPTSIEFRDELARTATGKLQKFKLRAPYWEGRDRQVN